MAKKHKRIWHGFFLLVLLCSLVAPFVSPPASVQATDPEQLCVPRHNDSSKVPDGWFRAEFRNRAVLTVTYEGSGECKSPSGANAVYIFGDKKFADVIAGDYIDMDTGDGTFEYVKRTGGNSQREESRVDRFSSDLDNQIADAFGGQDKAISSSNLGGLIANAEFIMGIEEDAVGADCEGLQNANWMLYDTNNDGRPIEWSCGASIPTSAKGFKVGGLIRDLDNFNITYRVKGQGTAAVIEHVSPGEQGTRTFKWCPSRNKFQSQNCEGDLYIDATVASIDGIGSGTGRFNLRSLSRSGSTEVQIAGTNNEDGQTVGEGGGAGNTNAGQAEDQGCESNGGDLGWLFCPLIRLLDSGISKIDEQINDLLEVPPSDYADDGPLHRAWANMRNLAYVILVPIVLLMVIGTALGFDFISAYTVKKALPRLIAAAMFIVLSWEITTFLITFTNNVGSGVLGLMTNAFGDGTIPTSFSEILNPGDAGFSLTAVAAGTIVAGIALGPALIGILLSYAFVAFIALLVGFVILALRQVILLALVLFAPLAILAWIFPGNDKLWKLWWNSFSKLLIMFPMIAALIAAGRIFAGVASVSQGSALGLFIKITAYIAPYFFIPATFKLAGGMFATIAGMANDRSRGLFDRQKKFRQEKAHEGYTQFKTGAVGAGIRGAASRNVGRRIGAGFKGRYGFGERGAQAYDQLARQASIDNIMKGPAWNGVNQNDDALRAATYESATEAQQKLTELWGDRERARRAVAAVQSSIGFGRPQAVAAAQQLVSTGTGYDSLKDMSTVMARASGGNANTMSALAGFGNAETKKVGRLDLAPGFGNLERLVRAEGGVATAFDGKPVLGENQTLEQFYDESNEEAWKAGSLYSIANGKPTQTKQFAKFWTEKYKQAMASGDVEGIRKAKTARLEMKNMLPNATGGNSEVLTKALADMDFYDQDHKEYVNSLAPADRATHDQTMTVIDRAAQQQARIYQRDPTDPSSNPAVIET